MKKRTALLSAAIGTLSFAAATTAPASAAATPARPNILVILVDDIGWSDTGAFGSEIRTPNIDKLAAEGKKFTQFYNTARCCPSRASLLTGLYPHQTGVGHMLWPTGYPGYTTHLTSDSVTMAEVLHDAGYRTYMAGKWHLSFRDPDPANPIGWPLQRGFDKFYGTILGYGSYFDPASLCRDFTYITPQSDPEYKPASYYYTDAISDNAIKFIDGRDTNHADQPFMMYVAYTGAHWPLHVPEDSLAEYKGKYDAGYDAIRQARIKRLKELGLMDQVGEPAPTTGKWDAVKDKAWEARRMEAFAAIITRMDQGIGKIVDRLRDKGELDNTLILFMQDNGGCDEEFFMNNHKAPENLHVMAANELQDRTLPPMQTRDGKVVKTGEGVMAGPADSFIGYGPEWANVSDTPFRKVKKYTYEGGISTPLIAHWPAGLAKSDDNIVTAPGHLIDIMPTVVEVAGATYPKQRNGVVIQPMEGKSLVPLLTGKGQFNRENPIFWEHEGNRAVRKGKWKLVSDENAPWELYDLETDRGEMKNLATQYPEIASDIASEWQKYSERAKVQPYGAHRLRTRQADPVGTSSTLRLDTGDVYLRKDAPALSDAGVSITATISKMAPNGVILAHGGSANGYALYMKDGKASFAVKRENASFVVSADVPPGEGPATIAARMLRDGSASITINGGEPTWANFYGPLLETPNEPLTAGFEQDTPVGDYEGMFSFQGDIDHVDLEILHK